MRYLALVFLIAFLHPPFVEHAHAWQSVAADEKVADLLEQFTPAGVMNDGSQPTPPEQSLDSFQMKAGTKIELVASEPRVTQPLHLSWDSKGRLWVVQYRQYQYPAGLKVEKFDQHLRVVFDKTPTAPPNHTPGNDCISILTDTDGDGRFDTCTDAITGLNIASSVAIGHRSIWVLNPPYLLRYPDSDRDGIPDGPPETHLSGFGLQDTHSVANNLMWGPDGWLYAVNGSTTIGEVSSRRTPATRFEGQCVWRYHPRKEVFEIYAEGGGNNFSLEIDAKGRVFSGTNGGNTRGWYFPQGSYSHKNWGKHGPLTNPYAFGYFPPMRFKGDGRRFPQAFTIYEGGLLGESFNGAIVAPNAMQNLVWHSQRMPDGSTYQTVDMPNLLESSDRWFRPVYCGVGPDGAIYIADWYDSRLSHISPTDDWHKSSGRIYRIAPENSQPSYNLGDLATKADADLILLFNHANKWVRQRSVLELSWRESIQESTHGALLAAAKESSLEALWVLGNRELLTDELAAELLTNSDADIRRWVVRLLGDSHRSHQGLAPLALCESDVGVRSQLASSARRLDATTGLQITRNLLTHSGDAKDPHIPLLLWWAVEEHAEKWDAVRAFLADESLWNEPLFASAIASRILRRYAATGRAADLELCAEILATCPSTELEPTLLSGLNRAFQGRTIPPLPPSLRSALSEFRAASGVHGLALGVRQADLSSQTAALAKLASSATPADDRIELASAFGDTAYPPATSQLLKLATRRSDTPALQRVALDALAAYDDLKIGPTLCKYLNSTISEDYGLRDAACRTLASRQSWAEAMLEELASWRLKTQHIPPDVVQRLRVYSSDEFRSRVDSVFGPPAQISSEEVRERIGELKTLLASGSGGDAGRGKTVFVANCGNCHSLFGVGEQIGPPLDNYDRANLDFWLPAIVAPSLEIREGYQSYAALLLDGRVLTGRLHAQDLQVVSIATDDGQIHTIARSEIDELRALKSSLMPEKILRSLSETQIKDLFAFLRSRTTKSEK